MGLSSETLGRGALGHLPQDSRGVQIRPTSSTDRSQRILAHLFGIPVDKGLEKFFPGPMSFTFTPPGSVAAALFSPALELLTQCQEVRQCPSLPDASWIHLGLNRVLHEVPSGRGFLQQHGQQMEDCPLRSNYFEALQSPRRLRLLTELNQRLLRKLATTLPDPLAQYSELAEFDLYAGDGHWHGAAAHDETFDDTKYAVGHFYTLDLRRHTLRHLAVGEGKKEHDMHVLKRLAAPTLRQGAPTGRKVLYVWDKAGIDFKAWHRWKQASGIYFISLEKTNMNLQTTGQPDWDRSDPVNAGILNVELVAGAAGVLLRRIHYIEPISGELLVFLTNEMTLRPGLIAFLYKLRWDIEKVFDQLKNKFNEQQAWASSGNAKVAQAQFICLLHNLLLGVEQRLLASGIENQAELARKAKTLEEAQTRAAAAGRKLPTPVVVIQRFTQRSVKLLRWLRSSIQLRLAWRAATPHLAALYATL